MAPNNIIIIKEDFNVDLLEPFFQVTHLNELLATFNTQRLDLAPTIIIKDTFSSIYMTCITSEYSSWVGVSIIHTGISNYTGKKCRDS